MHADFEEVSMDALAALRLVEAGEEHGHLPGKPPGDGRHLLICQLGGSRLHALPASGRDRRLRGGPVHHHAVEFNQLQGVAGTVVSHESGQLKNPG